MVATIDERRMARDERAESTDAIQDAKSTMLEKRRKLRVAIVTGELISERLRRIQSLMRLPIYPQRTSYQRSTA